MSLGKSIFCTISAEEQYRYCTVLEWRQISLNAIKLSKQIPYRVLKSKLHN